MSLVRDRSATAGPAGPRSVRAVVIERPGVITLGAIPEPVIGPHDVLVRSRRAGICRTDLNILRGEVPDELVSYPCVPGHEWSGTVEAVGPAVTGFVPGDRVVCEGRIPCGRCRQCGRGATNLCAVQRQLGFNVPGGYGELVAAPAGLVHHLPDHVSLDAAVLIEPAACVARALARVGPPAGATIGVVGVGTLGAIALRLVRLFDPRAVVAFGVRREELALAARLGADHAVDVSSGVEGAARGVVGDGLDVVIEVAGTPGAVDTATEMVRPGGRVGLVGLAGWSSVLQLPADRIVRKDLTITGNLSSTSEDWFQMVKILDERRIDLEGVVTHRYPLERFDEAFALLERPSGVVGKIVLTLDR